MSFFATLPEETVSEILSRTSPLDVSRFAAISKGFKSAAEADYVWSRFLPTDWPEIVSRSVSPVVYTTMKELYFTLCDSPISLDGGKLIFSLDKKSGKKCYLIGARELEIAWSVDTPWYWDWKSHPHSRFEQVAELQSVCWLDIRGKINAQILTPNTAYAAYLVFKLMERCKGLGWLNAAVRFADDEPEGRSAAVGIVHLQQGGGRNRARRKIGEVPARRSDRWMEVELGRFSSDREGEVEARLMQIERRDWKSGLIVEGIQFRPIQN